LSQAHVPISLSGAEFDVDAEAVAWLVKKITAGFNEAEEAGYKRGCASGSRLRGPNG
jgi:hypothetical protein